MAKHKSFSDPDIIVGTFADITALKNVDTSDTSGCPQYARAYVETNGEYYLDRNSTRAEDLPNVVLPDNSIGRWIFSGGLTNNNLIKRLDSLGGGGITSADNGLTVSGSEVKLGGNLVEYTSINGNSNTLNISSLSSWYANTSNGVIQFTAFYSNTENRLEIQDGYIFAKSENTSTDAYTTFQNQPNLGYWEHYDGSSITARVDLSDSGLQLKTDSNYANLKATNLTSDRDIEFPNASGTLALTSDIPTYTASNGITKSTNDFQLGGTLASGTSIFTGGNNFTLVDASNFSGMTVTTGVTRVASSLFPNQNFIQFDNSGGTARILNDYTNGSILLESFGTTNNGVRIRTAGGSLGTNYAKLKTTNLTSERTFEFPNTSGTIALTSDVSGYLPLTLTSPTNVVDIDGNGLTFNDGSIIKWHVADNLFYDNSNTESVDMINRTLKNSAGAVAVNYSGGTNGLRLSNIGSSNLVALKNTNVTATRTIEFPNASGTIALTTDLTSYVNSTNGSVTIDNNTSPGYFAITTDSGAYNTTWFEMDNTFFYLGDDDANISYSSWTANQLDLKNNVGNIKLETDTTHNIQAVVGSNQLKVDNTGVNVSTNSNFASLNTTNLTTNRDYEFPDNAGTLLAVDVINNALFINVGSNKMLIGGNTNSNSTDITQVVGDEFIEYNGTGGHTITLHTFSGYVGNKFFIKNNGSGIVTVDANGSETIDGNLTFGLSVGQGVMIKVLSSTTATIYGGL